MSSQKYDAIVVGAGFSGLYMLHKLRTIGFNVKVYETGGDVGGTWYWNRYPGARCDCESMEYSYSFDVKLQQEWNWSQMYAPQPEILKYMQHCAERFDLRKDIQFNTKVVSAQYHEDSNQWEITTDTGEHAFASFCVIAAGCLSKVVLPSFKGMESFKGQLYHTGKWPHEGVDFTGKRVGVIGTGSSGVQIIPVVANQAAHLTVFQRTANYSVPAHNKPLTPEYVEEYKKQYADVRDRARNSVFGFAITPKVRTSALAVSEEERNKTYQMWWDYGGLSLVLSFNDHLTSVEANNKAKEFIAEKIKAKVKDPNVAKLLTPTELPFGAKRPLVDHSYYETYNRDNVTLVDIKHTPIEEITPNGLKVGDKQYELDIIVCATGFDAMTGALNAIDIRGVGGKALKEKWEAGPREYLGLMSAGFPNFFTITGPGSPSVLSSMNVSIEYHVEWIADVITFMRKNNYHRIDASQEAEDKWSEGVNEAANRTLYVKANTWYNGANVPGKPRMFMPYTSGIPKYKAKCDEIIAKRYAGFVFV